MHLKIRIFALAKEMGLDSKDLIEYCNQAGIHLKNSALASISPEERDVVLRHIEQNASSRGTAQDTLAPVREAAPVTGGKVRQLDVPRRPALRPLRASDESSAVAVAEDHTAVAVAEPPTVAARIQAIEPELEPELEEPEAAPAAEALPESPAEVGGEVDAPAAEAAVAPGDVQTRDDSDGSAG
jgi:translation initiation factor IF-2